MNSAGDSATCATLYPGGCRQSALFAVGDAVDGDGVLE